MIFIDIYCGKVSSFTFKYHCLTFQLSKHLFGPNIINGVNASYKSGQVTWLESNRLVCKLVQFVAKITPVCRVPYSYRKESAL